MALKRLHQKVEQASVLDYHQDAETKRLLGWSREDIVMLYTIIVGELHESEQEAVDWFDQLEDELLEEYQSRALRRYPAMSHSFGPKDMDVETSMASAFMRCIED